MATTISTYRTYNFKDKDPVIDQVRTMWQDSGLKLSAVSEESGVSSTTLYNWFDGDTRRPQSATVEAVGRALGYERRWVKAEIKRWNKQQRKNGKN